MKVLHINSYFSTSSFYKNLFDQQQKQGINLSVYVPIARNINCDGINFGDYTKISKNHGKYDRYIFSLKHKKIFNDIINQFSVSEFDLLHAHSLFSNGYIAYRLKKIYGIPYIVAVRDTDLNTFFKRMPHLRKLGIEILKQANRVVFLSAAYRKKTIETYVPYSIQKEIQYKSTIIPNGVDLFWLKNKPQNFRLPEKNIKVIYVGRISQRKNVTTTVEACNILRDRGYNVTFTVVGQVEDQKEFQAINTNGSVNYYSPKPKEELIHLYRSHDVFVMPSRTETFGLVYAEAMSQGVPVIYSKGQGFDEQFDEGLVGYHVDCYNAEEIADRILDVLKNHDTLRTNCLKLSDKFDWNKIAKEYNGLYQESIDGKLNTKVD